MTDADAFFDFTTLDGNGVIGVDLYDGKWSSFDKFKLGVAVRDVDKYLIVNFELMCGATLVGAKKTGVDKGLSIFGKCDNVGHKWKVKEHVAIEDESAGGIVAESGNGIASKSVHCGCKSFVDDVIGVGFSLGGLESEQCAYDLTNDFVGSFDDGIGCGCVRRNVFAFDAGVLNRKLKVMTVEFWAVVVYNFCGSRIAGKPIVFE